MLARVMEVEEGHSSLVHEDKVGGDPGRTPPHFYDVSCDINYRKSGSLFVDVFYTLL